MSAMQFDSVMVGSRIMKLRKAAGMTQMQLAETMGVSFQAVSNWERGMSCPDIARLTELAALLGVSVDEILGSKKAACVAEAIAKDEKIPAMSAEEMVEIAPVLTQAQADAAGERVEHVSLEELIRMAPFLSEETLDRLAERACDEGGKLSELCGLAPFLSEEAVGRLAGRIYENDGDVSMLCGLAPFMDESALTRIAARVAKKEGVSALMPLMPFLDDEQLGGFLGEWLGGKGE